tara:strand:+ start:440 stop:1093 length:654 start_codon:yes stop_codon:yes gene_type:complete
VRASWSPTPAGASVLVPLFGRELSGRYPRIFWIHPSAKAKNKRSIVAKKKKAEKESSGFKTGNWVVYPTHGVGKVTGVEDQEIAGTKLKLVVISFERDRMTLRVPIDKAEESGLRRLSSKDKMKGALKTLRGRSRVRRTMWSRRAQEYEAKINSGDPVSIAEVVRDLHRKEDQPDQSYSERQIYQAALDRLVRELAAVEDIDEEAAIEQLEGLLKAA